MPHARDIAASFDPARLAPEFYEDPYPTYAALREHAPVHRCADGTWFLTRYADLDRLYRDREHVSSEKKEVFAPKYGIDSLLFAHHTTSLVLSAL
jgi:cytochrome P450